MYWLDGFTFDENLMNNSFLSADSNGELSDNNHRISKASTSSSGHINSGFRSSNRKTHHLRGLTATTKAKRRRHAHYKLNTRLDRKSSRGMIYENEELRLRTININAEVERGQTDIKRLRKENEQLRREIWTLRDECDRLNKRVKAKFVEHEQGVYSARCSGGNGCPCQCNDGIGCDLVHSRCNSEDSDSCDSCCCHDDEEEAVCNDECCNESKNMSNSNECISPTVVNEANETVITSATESVPVGTSKLTNFDHLSVVSEENLSNSEVVSAQQSENLLSYTHDISGSQTTLPSLVGPLTPLTPVEMVANELNDLQAVVPPLSYFENIVHQHMNANYGSTPESTSTTKSGKTIVKHTNGWDYNLESPFAQRRYPVNSISPIMSKRSSAQTLTTFVPTTTVTPPPSDVITSNGKPIVPKKPTELNLNMPQNPVVIETVPIITMPPNGGVVQQLTTASSNSDNNGSTTPKHFFAPIKPKLKLNTALANQKRMPPPAPPLVNEPVTQTQSLGAQQKCEPPDIYVTNGLATPYRPPNKPTVQPPPIPQRLTSTSTTMQAQVSSSQRQRNRQQQQYQPHQHQHQHQTHIHRRMHQMCRYQHQLHHNNLVITNNDDHNDDDVYVMPAIYVTNATSITTLTTTSTVIVKATNLTNNSLCTSTKTNLKSFCPLTTTVLTSNTLCNTLNPLLLTTEILTATTPSSSTLLSAIPPPPTSSSLTLPAVTTEIGAAATTSFPLTMVYLTPTPLPPPPSACFKFINSNINFRKPNDPVYAIAQNVCQNLITASAVTQPLMSSIVKCCIAKQQQLQQLITAASSSSTSSTTIQSFCITTAANKVASDVDGVACDDDGGVVTMPPLPSADNIMLSSLSKYSSVACNLTKNSYSSTSIKKAITTTPTASTNSIVVDSMCQTDSANLESILNDIEAISEDILAIQLVKNKSRENLNKKSTDEVNKTEIEPLQQNNKNSKPYRSEMNLLLTYEDNNPTIKPVQPLNTTESNKEIAGNSNVARRTRSLERDHTDSPSPNIPDPMQPFPDNRKYIGFDRINKAAVIATTTAPEVAATATQTSPVLNSPTTQRIHLPLSPLVTNISGQKAANGKSFPPTPPVRQYPSPLNIKCAGIARSNSVTGSVPSTKEPNMNSPVLAGVSPNKSQLYAALANAAAKRAQFRSQPTQLTKSFDYDFNVPDNTNESEVATAQEEKELAEHAKRKARRVSIVCNDTDSPGTPEKPIPSIRTQLAAQASASGSCMDLHTVLSNPSLRNLKQTSQSTPNSPHSARKHESSPLNTPPVPPIISVTPTSTPPHLQRTNSSINSAAQLLAHNHAHSNSYPNVVSPLTQLHQQPRKNSQDAIKASAAEIACAAANAMRTKCSRRHSDGTVSHTNQRISNTSAGTNGTHHHHTHNHHHHQHSSSLVSQANPHHSHHSRQDSNHETVASYSDRNSNSLASSRESSASFSMRSQRRKLSVSSHTGGKIPWCGCWGNGCL